MLTWLRKDKRVLVPVFWKKDGKCMPGQQKGNGKKTGNRANPQFSSTDTSNVFTDYDAIDTFNRVLLKKIGKMDHGEPVAER